MPVPHSPRPSLLLLLAAAALLTGCGDKPKPTPKDDSSSGSGSASTPDSNTGSGGAKGADPKPGGGSGEIPAVLKDDARFKQLATVFGSEYGRHWGPVRCVAFSPDGKTIASGGDDAAVRVWDADTLRPVKVLDGAGGPVLSVTFSADGKRVAGGCFDGAAQLWDLAAPGTPTPLKAHDGPVTGVAFSPDGNWLATTGGKGVVLWKVGGPNPKQGPTLPGAGGTFSPDSKYVSAGGKVWDLSANPPKEAPADAAKFPPTTAAVQRGAAVSPDGTRKAEWTDKQEVRLTHIAGQFIAEVVLPGHTAAGQALTFSADGKRLVSGGDDQQLRLWDVHPDRPVRLVGVAPKDPSTWPPALSADGNTLAVGRLVQPRVSSEHVDWDLWDVSGPDPKRMGTVSVGPPEDKYHRETRVALAPDGKRLAVGGPGKMVRLFNVGPDPKELARFEVQILGDRTFRGIDGLVFSPDGKRLAVIAYSQAPTDNAYGLALHLWRLEGSKPTPLHVIDTDFQKGYTVSVQFSPDGQGVALSRTDRYPFFELYDLRAEGPVRRAKLSTVGGGAGFTADGQQLLYGWPPKVWKLSEPVPAQNNDGEDKVSIAAMLANGRMVTTDASGGIAVADDVANPRVKCQARAYLRGVSVKSRRIAVQGYSTSYPIELFSLDYGESKPHPTALGPAAPCLAVAAAGGKVATGGADGTVRLWRADGSEQAVIREHSGPVTAVAFTADGTKLATGSADKTVLLWDVSGDAPKELPTYTGHGVAVRGLSFSADGKTLAVASGDDTVRLWDLTPARPAERAKVPARAAVVATDGKRLAVVGTGGSTEVWDISGTPRQLEAPWVSGVAAVAISPDGKRVAAGTEAGVRVYPADNKEAKPAEWGTGPVTRVSFSPDGKRLAAVEGKGRVVVRDAGGKVVAEWPLPGPVNELAFTPDGRHLVTANNNGTAYALRLPE